MESFYLQRQKKDLIGKKINLTSDNLFSTKRRKNIDLTKYGFLSLEKK